MYVPAHFALPDADALAVLAAAGACDLVTTGPDGLTATYLPFQHEPGAGLGSLTAHLARNNDQWRHTGEALVIAHGPDHYVSPAWLPSLADNPRQVPTWDYVTVHAYGELVVHDDVDWLRAHVRALTERHEAGEATPWRVEDAGDYAERMLRAVVGVEVRLTRVVGKAKMAQNKPPADVEALAAYVEASDPEGARYLREVSLPAACRRAGVLDDVAAGRYRAPRA